MLYGNPNNEPYRILSIDPGTNTLGYAVIDVDLVNCTKTLVYATTFTASKQIDDLLDSDQWKYLEERYLRIKRQGDFLRGMFLQYQPHLVVHESAFMGKFAQAFQALTECLYELRTTIKNLSPYTNFIGVTPMEVKWALGGSISKDQVFNSVSKIKDLDGLSKFINISDEHAIDAIAIGYTTATQILEGFK